MLGEAGLTGMSRWLGECRLGAVVLAGSETGATCANGMPMAPGAVRMLGRLAALQELDDHPALTRHIAVVRCTTVPNAAILIAEHHEESLDDVLLRGRGGGEEGRAADSLPVRDVPSLACQMAAALGHLHERRVVAGMIETTSVLVVPPPVRNRTGQGGEEVGEEEKDEDLRTYRLAHYGLPLLSDNGADLATLIGSPYTMAPERMLARVAVATGGRSAVVSPCTRKADVWAFGMVLLQAITRVPLHSLWTPVEWLRILNRALKEAEGPTPSLYAAITREVAEVHAPARERLDTLDKEGEEWGLRLLVEDCLRVRPSTRPSMVEIRRRMEEAGTWEGQADYDDEKRERNVPEMIREAEEEGDEWVYKRMSLVDAFFLWTLSGSAVEKILLERGVVKTKTPVLGAPLVAVDDFALTGNEEGRRFHAVPKATTLPMNNLIEKLMSMDPQALLYSFELNDGRPPPPSDLPVVVKEKDVSYQAARNVILAHLVRSYAFKPQLLRETAKEDVPPLRRSAVWRALLGVTAWESEENFVCLDTVSPHSSDRQLDVDIPRCHQYEEVMTSPSAHYKLKRLLKAWLMQHPQYVYWQGLDSLAAPFLLLNFENLPAALGCLSSFIDRYLRDFFLKDNSHVIQGSTGPPSVEYLAVFNHLVSYVDAPLYTALADMDFFPELFAIPWFLTCFAHVLPLNKLFHVWDAMLLAETHFPLFVGVSILLQLRPSLIGASFNDVILLFSDLPDLNIERILSDTMAIYGRVPRSCAHLAQRRDQDAGHTMSEFRMGELKAFCTPRISREDVVRLVHKEALAIIDLRSQPEFHRGAIIRSVNYPNVEDESLASIRVLLSAAQSNAVPIVLVDVKHLNSAKKFASLLVRNGVCGVCILDGGYDSVRGCSPIIQVTKA